MAANTANAATTYYVRTNGNDANAGTSAEQAWKTIARALPNSASTPKVTAGDTVYILAGTYAYTTYKQNADTGRSDWITYRAYDVHNPPVVQGLFINSTPNAYVRWYDINFISDANYGTVEIYTRPDAPTLRTSYVEFYRCLIQQTAGYPKYALGLYRSDHIVIDDCNLASSLINCYMGSCTYVVMNNNLAHDAVNDGFHFIGSQYITITRNSIYNVDKANVSEHRDGMSIDSCNDVNVAGNKMWDVRGQGISVGTGVGYNTGHRILIENNLLYGIITSGQCKTTTNTDGLTIRNNTFVGVGTGSTIPTTSSNVIVSNNIIRGDYGIFSTDGNIVVKNNIFEHYTNVVKDRVAPDATNKILDTLGLTIRDVGFTNFDGNDFSLAANSFAINDGNDTYGTTTDILGNSRDSQPDAGCYEYIDFSFAPIGNKEVYEGSTLTFIIDVNNSDVKPFIEDHNLPDEPNLTNNIFSWTPSYNDAGSYEVTFLAQTELFDDTETISILINNVTDTSTYEAEDAVRSGAVVDNVWAGYTGTGFADYMNASNDYTQWTVNVGSSGQYELQFRYALARGNRPLQIKVNGQEVVPSLSFPATGSWTSWGTVSTTATLSSGQNTVRAIAIGSSGGNVDRLKVVDTTPPAPTTLTWAVPPAATGQTSISMTVTTAADAVSSPVLYYFECTTESSRSSGWQSSPVYTATGLTADTAYTFRCKAHDNATTPNETGWSSSLSATTQSNTIEAEDSVLSGAVVSNVRAGYTGTGFADYMNASGDFVEWTVNVDSSGQYELQFRYALAIGNRPLQIKVNGQEVVSSLSFPATGGWTSWGTVSTTATLSSGQNTVQAIAIGSSGGNVDHLKIISGN